MLYWGKVLPSFPERSMERFLKNVSTREEFRMLFFCAAAMWFTKKMFELVVIMGS